MHVHTYVETCSMDSHSADGTVRDRAPTAKATKAKRLGLMALLGKREGSKGGGVGIKAKVRERMGCELFRSTIFGASRSGVNWSFPLSLVRTGLDEVRLASAPAGNNFEIWGRARSLALATPGKGRRLEPPFSTRPLCPVSRTCDQDIVWRLSTTGMWIAVLVVGWLLCTA